MARYPTIDAPFTPLDSNPLPYQHLDAPLAAFGGQQVQALGNFGDAVQQGIASYRGQLARQSAQQLPHDMAAQNAVDRFLLDAQHHHTNYAMLRHADAIAGLDDYRKSLQDSRDAAVANVPAPIRGVVQPHIDRLHNEALRLGLEHRNAQDHAWSDHSSQASLDVDVQEALLWRNNPAQVSRVLDRALGEWFKIGERKGWNEQQLGQQIAQWNGQLYGTLIGQHLSDGNIQGAQTLLADAQQRVDPQTFERLSNQVATGATRIPNPANQTLPIVDRSGDRSLTGSAGSKGIQYAQVQPTTIDDAGGTNIGERGRDDEPQVAQTAQSRNQAKKAPPAVNPRTASPQPKPPPSATPGPSNGVPPPLPGTSGLLTMSQQFKEQITDEESRTSGEYTARNPPPGKDPWVALGRYQIQRPGLQDAGFIDKKGNWTGPAAQRFGVHSEQDFRNNPPAQEAALAAYMAKQAAYLKADGSLSSIGQKVNGIEGPFSITYDGLLAAAHREGAKRVSDYLTFLHVNNFDSREILDLPNSNIMEPNEERRKKIKEKLEETKQRFLNIEKRLRNFADTPFYRRPEDYPPGVR